MFESEKFSKFTLFLIQALVFALTVIIYSLSVSILNDTVTSASIALSQFAGDGVSLTGIFIGVIILGAFNLSILIALFIIGSIIKSWSWYILSLGLINLLFNLISEALFFKFATCFNYTRNAIVVARSILVIIFMISIICVAEISIFSIFNTKIGNKKSKQIPGCLLLCGVLLMT